MKIEKIRWILHETRDINLLCVWCRLLYANKLEFKKKIIKNSSFKALLVQVKINFIQQLA